MNAAHRILFLGTPAFAVVALEALIGAGYDVICVTQPDKPVGRKRLPGESAVKRSAREHNLQILQPVKLDESFLAVVKKHGPFAVGIVVAYGKILKPSLLRVPERGFLNIHASLLPRHRGASPIQSAILAGDEETGVTIMQIDEGLDTGPIVAQRRVPLAGTENAGELSELLAPVGAQLLISVLPDVLRGTSRREPQSSTTATLTSLFTKDDARLCWDDPAETSERKVRAFNPEPVAWTEFFGKRLNVPRSFISQQQSSEKPGTLIALDNERLLGVVCGDGKVLALAEAQIEGKNLLDGLTFFHGYRKRVGAVCS